MYNEEYYVNRGTCAVVPLSKNVSKIIEIDQEFIVNKSVKDIINESCKYYGSSYQGRFDGSKKILNMNYKLPIVICEKNSLIFFPTSSPRFDSCIWICLNNLCKYSKNDKESIVYFNNNTNLCLKISYYCLESQIFRATLLDSLLKKRSDL